ncbi:MAG: HdeA/HdeB family chaperone [Candidatus Binatia bacterium]
MDSKRKTGVFLVGLMIGGTVLATGVFAAPTQTKKINPKQMTCEEFLALGEEVQPHVVYWIDGYAKSGKLTNESVEVDAFARPVTAVIAACKQKPKETLWQKVKSYF